MVDIDVIGILTVQVLQAIICKSTIYTFNTFKKQADNENNNNPIAAFWVFNFFKFFLITIA